MALNSTKGASKIWIVPVAVLIIIVLSVVLLVYVPSFYAPSIKSVVNSTSPTSINSTSTVSAGFSPFILNTVICDSSGLTVAFTTGGLANGVTFVTIQQMWFSSATGINPASSATTNITPITAISGDTFDVVFSSVKCTSGASFSATGDLQYVFTNATGSETVNATGTIAGIGT